MKELNKSRISYIAILKKDSNETEVHFDLPKNYTNRKQNEFENV